MSGRIESIRNERVVNLRCSLCSINQQDDLAISAVGPVQNGLLIDGWLAGELYDKALDHCISIHNFPADGGVVQITMWQETIEGETPLLNNPFNFVAGDYSKQ